MASRFSVTDTELKAQFIQLDRNHDGKLSYEEFIALLENLNADMSQQEMKLGFHEIDTNKDGLIDRVEFAQWWRSD